MNTRSSLETLVKDTRGGVLLEYVIVLAFAGAVVAVALAAIGPATVRNYSGQRAAIYLSNP